MSQVPSPSPAVATPSAAEPSDTKERLLDAAERLFAERGFEGASMRAVTQAAGSAVSAANYHFGSKEALLAAVIRRRIQPVNRQRVEALDRLEAQAGSGSCVPLEELLDAFLRPSFERMTAAREEGSGAIPRQIVARLYVEPPELVQPLRAELFGEVNERYLAAFARIFPDASLRALRMIQELAVASLVHVLSGQLDDELTHELEGSASAGVPPHEPLLQMLIAHTGAGARAVVASERGESE